ncbi:hypothetical protein NIES4071_17670 [Calothrix sp. NIES-4071]|nr:hypothetical protein NIES4071_17670 [Calothrix sp. NIES-4071]BAZ56100.1 hypothetical protein NIES4105_17620 [Calothrix sp. NIES-4105]
MLFFWKNPVLFIKSTTNLPMYSSFVVRVTITRSLMQLEAEGKLIRHKRQIIVTDNLLPQK